MTIGPKHSDDASKLTEGNLDIARMPVSGTWDITDLVIETDTVTIGTGEAGKDYALKFDGEDNDGILTWHEDENYFGFDTDFKVANGSKMGFRVVAGVLSEYIHSPAVNEIDVKAKTKITLDAPTIEHGDGTAANITNTWIGSAGTLTLTGVTGAIDFFRFDSYVAYTQTTNLFDDIIQCYGTGYDYSIGYHSASDTLRIIDGVTLTSDIRMLLDANGDFGFGGVTSPLGKVHIGQLSSSGAKIALILEQDDVDIAFAGFIGAAANGDLTRNIVDEGDQSGQTLEGWIMFYIQDDGNQVTDGNYFIPFYSLS